MKDFKPARREHVIRSPHIPNMLPGGSAMGYMHMAEAQGARLRKNVANHPPHYRE